MTWLKIAIALIKQAYHIWMEDDPTCKKKVERARKSRRIIRVSCDCGEIFYEYKVG